MSARIGFAPAIAVYVGALLGPGMLTQPAFAAKAGPRSPLARTAFQGVRRPLATRCTDLAARHPDSCGRSAVAVRVYGGRAFAGATRLGVALAERGAPPRSVTQPSPGQRGRLGRAALTDAMGFGPFTLHMNSAAVPRSMSVLRAAVIPAGTSVRTLVLPAGTRWTSAGTATSVTAATGPLWQHRRPPQRNPCRRTRQHRPVVRSRR